MFGDVPSQTNWKHDIDVGDAQPIKQQFYRISPSTVDVSIWMLRLIICSATISQFPHHPVRHLCVFLCQSRKEHLLFCTDLRKVKSDSFIYMYMVWYIWYRSDQVCQVCYRQVPLSKHAQEILAFVTPSGFYCVVLVLQGCTVYLDDLVIYSDTFIAFARFLNVWLKCVSPSIWLNLCSLRLQ